MGNRRRSVSACKSCFCCREDSRPPYSRNTAKHELCRARTHKDKVLRNTQRMGGSGVYEDVMLYVRDGPAAVPRRRGRGRPRKVPLEPTRQIVSSPPEIIYVPSTAEQRQTCTIIPIKGKMCAQAPPTPARTSDAQDEIINWPADLKDLLTNWDQLPENSARQVMKWLMNPRANTYPPTINSMHELVWANSGTVDDKIEELEEVLQAIEQPSTHVKARTVTVTATAPKVVVEVEPVPLQNCGQWSSMADHRQ